MRVLAIGDIHGCANALDTLLAEIKLQPEDTLVTLGDYVDRGPDSKGVFDRLLELSEQYHLVSLRGNHEQMLLQAYTDKKAEADWIENGGDATLSSYGSLAAIPEAHWKFIEEQCVDCWESETHFFVHASVYPDLPLLEQPRYILYWGRFINPQPHESGKIMVCGHTSQKNGLPAAYPFAVCIDTYVHGGGWLTCLDTGSGLLYQANQHGETRRLYLQDFMRGFAE